ncbi:MAG: VWA domain-containing protein [Acidobacteriota bacterium]
MAQQDAETTFRAASEAVVLDVVVRDKKGRPISDLRADEIKIFENGVQQEIRTFRSVVGGSNVIVTVSDQGGRVEVSPQLAQPGQPDPFRHINLVTMVFERLGLEERQLAQQTAKDFLDLGLGTNTYVAIFVVNLRLSVLQPFTSDRDELEEAIEQATSGAYGQFAEHSAEIQQELETMSGATAAGESAAAQVGQGSLPSGDMGMSFAEATMAQMTLNMLRMSQSLAREQQGITSLHALLSIIREQQRLAGRKTVLYFSTGLHVPPNQVDLLRTTISEANRANLSFYSIDARGLTSQNLSGGARDMLRQAAGASRSQVSSGGGRAVTRAEVMAVEHAEASIRMNTQETLADLARSTGGFLLANTNDFRPGIERLSEDIHSYYEIGYIPASVRGDGSFHAIEVKVSRPDVTVQTRSGYFDVPQIDQRPILPYEVPMLAALTHPQLPRDFQYRARALRFDDGNGGVHHTLIMEVPLQDFTFKPGEDSQSYSARFSVMALVKDSDGEVIQRFSEDYPLSGPLERVEELKQGNLFFIRNFHLQPGRYRLETVAYDHETGMSSAQRSLLYVRPEPNGVALSSVLVVLRADPLAQEDQAQHNPLHFGNLKILPNLDVPLQKNTETAVSIYLVVYPSRQIADDPVVVIQFLQDGQVVGQARPELPSPQGDSGEIPYMATIPLSDFDPGRYEVRVLAQQGQTAVKEHTFFTLQ